MSDLRGLIERVEKASGAMTTREIEECIRLSPWYDTHPLLDPIWNDFCRALQGSLDAALALVEKMRPGYRWGVSSVAIKIGAYPDGKTAYGEGFRAHVTKNSPLRPMPSTADAPTPALAIVLALLRAFDTDNKGAVHGAP